MIGIVYVLNGPNLNLLGSSEPTICGRETLADVEVACRGAAGGLGIDIDFRQTNHEGVLIDSIHEARSKASGIVINPGRLTHTSIALMGALSASELPIAAVHVSNIHRRESFRHLSYVSRVATGVIRGLGPQGLCAGHLGDGPADRAAQLTEQS
ncbi:MAG: type II 3-dehydroquinate dehydratase [Geminicoccaceae bacterium]